MAPPFMPSDFNQPCAGRNQHQPRETDPRRATLDKVWQVNDVLATSLQGNKVVRTSSNHCDEGVSRPSLQGRQHVTKQLSGVILNSVNMLHEPLPVHLTHSHGAVIVSRRLTTHVTVSTPPEWIRPRRSIHGVRRGEQAPRSVRTANPPESLSFATCSGW